MDIAAITQAITTLGFPIVCVFFLWQSIKDTMKNQQEETKRLREILEKNTLVLTKLMERLKVEEGDDEDVKAE